MVRFAGCVAAAIGAWSLGSGSAEAQTAYDINRLNQAVQICNSPMGAGMAECAQLRAKLGGGGGAPGVPGLGGLGVSGKAAGLTSLLGVAVNMAQSRQAAVAQPPTTSPGAVQQAIATCVQNARGDNAAIQTCLQIANAGTAATPQGAPSGVAYAQSGGLPSVDRNTATAVAIHQNGQSYQACAAANPTNWQQCLPLLNGGAAAPASNPFGNLLPRR